MACRAALLRLALLCLLGGAWASLKDEEDDSPKYRASAEALKRREQLRTANQAKLKAQADADGRLRLQRIAERRVTVAAKQEQVKADHAEAERLALRRKKADEMAALRPMVQAQRKAEREKMKEDRKNLATEDAKRAAEQEAKDNAEQQVRLQAMKDARDMALQEMQAKMQDAREKAEKEKRREMLRAKWQSILEAKQEAEREAMLPEEDRKQLAETKARRAAQEKAVRDEELRKQQRAEEKKREKIEREKQYRVVQRMREAAERDQLHREEAKLRRDADYAALQRSKEKRVQAALARQRAQEMEGSQAEEGRSNSVLLVVRHSGGEETEVRVSQQARLQVLLATIAQRLGVEPSSLRLSHAGSQLSPTDAVGFHEFEDGDVIDADTVLQH